MYGEGQSVEAAHEAARTERKARQDLIAELAELTQQYALADVKNDAKRRKEINEQIEELERKMAA